MSDVNMTPRKVVKEYESSVSHVRVGHCPRCNAVMSYRNIDQTECTCCGVPIYWEIKK